MRLYYYRDPEGNFGDDMNAWMWNRVAPEITPEKDGTALCGIGTIINARMPKHDRWIVFGSGAGYGPAPTGFGGPGWHILAVRGPLSARVLGISEDHAVTDGAMLLSTLPEFQPAPESERHGTIFVPNHGALKAGRWPEVAARAGFEFLDPRGESRAVIERLRTAKLVLADAMHGAIVADTMRVPWIPFTTGAKINTFKWLDWTRSMALRYEPLHLPPSSVTNAIDDATVGLYGMKYRLARVDEELAVADFRRQSYWKTRSWWKGYEKRARRYFTKGPAKLLTYPPFSALAGRDEGMMDRAAAALRAGARRTPYLSDDRHFALRQSQMLERAETLRSLIRTPVGRGA